MRWKPRLISEAITIDYGEVEWGLWRSIDGPTARTPIKITLTRADFLNAQLKTGKFTLPPVKFNDVESFINAVNNEDYPDDYREVRFEHIVAFLQQYPLRMMVNKPELILGPKGEPLGKKWRIGEAPSLEEHEKAWKAVLNKFLSLRTQQFKAEGIANPEELARELARQLYRIMYDKSRELVSTDPKTKKRILAPSPIVGRDHRINFGKGTSPGNVDRYLSEYLDQVKKMIDKEIPRVFALDKDLKKLVDYSYEFDTYQGSYSKAHVGLKGELVMGQIMQPELEPEQIDQLRREVSKRQISSDTILKNWIKNEILSYDERMERGIGDEDDFIVLQAHLLFNFGKVAKLIKDSELIPIPVKDGVIHILKTGFPGVVNVLDRIDGLFNRLRADRNVSQYISKLIKIDGDLSSTRMIESLKPLLKGKGIEVSDSDIVFLPSES